MYEKVLKNPENFDFKVQQLGDPTHPNPSNQDVFVSEEERIAFSSQIKKSQLARFCSNAVRKKNRTADPDLTQPSYPMEAAISD